MFCINQCYESGGDSEQWMWVTCCHIRISVLKMLMSLPLKSYWECKSPDSICCSKTPRCLSDIIPFIPISPQLSQLVCFSSEALQLFRMMLCRTLSVESQREFTKSEKVLVWRRMLLLAVAQQHMPTHTHQPKDVTSGKYSKALQISHIWKSGLLFLL